MYLGTNDPELDFVSALGDISLVTANLNDCNFRKPWRDIKKFCNTPQVDKDAKDLAP